QIATLGGDEANDYFGFTSAYLGDVNADGVPDFGIGGYRGSVAGRGRIKVYSGDDGSLIHHILGPVGGNLGLVFAVGDVNGDGYDDFGGNHAFGFARGTIFSGLDGSELVHTPMSYLFGGVGDRDGDGHADYVSRSSDSGVGTTFRVISGSDGSELFDLSTGSGWFAGFLGDVNGDGLNDYGTVVSTSSQDSIIEIHSGDSNAVFFHLGAPRRRVQNVYGIGDSNGDGFPDLAVAFDDGQSVDVCSGHDGTVLMALRDIPLNWFSSGYNSLSGVPDADGDGHADFIVATAPPRLYSGRTGALIAEFLRDSGQTSTHSVAGLPDANGDGWPEVVVGSPGIFDPISFGGTAALYSYDGPAGSSFCPAAVNSTGAPAELTASGSSSLDRNNLLLSVHSAPPTSVGIFLMGAGQQQTPLGSGVLCVGTPGGGGIARLPLASINSSGQMVQHFDASAPAGALGPITAGTTRTFQAWFRDASPAGPVSNLSTAAFVTFVP
ncbi:MAG: hypothetical protein AAGG01_05515, partial [Planctomycetota bacterium]